jgi:hypothetical protein
MNAGKANFGLLLVVIGLAVFAVNTGLMHWSVYFDLLDFWPVLLIALGIQIIFKKTLMPQLSYLSTLILIVVSAYVLYDNLEIQDSGDSARSVTISKSRIKNSTTDVEFGIYADESEISVTGSQENLVDCKFESVFMRPEIDVDWKGSTPDVLIKKGGFSKIHVMENDDFMRHWDIALYNLLPCIFEIDSRRSELNLDLSNFLLTRFTARIPYSDLYLKLGSRSKKIDVDITANRAHLNLNVPDTAGIRILNSPSVEDEITGMIEFVQDSAGWSTPGFDTAGVKITLEINGNPSNLRFRRH